MTQEFPRVFVCACVVKKPKTHTGQEYSARFTRITLGARCRIAGGGDGGAYRRADVHVWNWGVLVRVRPLACLRLS